MFPSASSRLFPDTAFAQAAYTYDADKERYGRAHTSLRLQLQQAGLEQVLLIPDAAGATFQLRILKGQVEPVIRALVERGAVKQWPEGAKNTGYYFEFGRPAAQYPVTFQDNANVVRQVAHEILGREK
jgi:hypothetical protein